MALEQVTVNPKLSYSVSAFLSLFFHQSPQHISTPPRSPFHLAPAYPLQIQPPTLLHARRQRFILHILPRHPFSQRSSAFIAIGPSIYSKVDIHRVDMKNQFPVSEEVG